MNLKQRKEYVDEMIGRFVDATHNNMPLEREDKDKMLQRMRAVGYLTDKELESYTEALWSEDE